MYLNVLISLAVIDIIELLAHISRRLKCLYARGWMNLDSLRFSTRQSVRNLASRSYAILYSRISRISIRLWSDGR